MADPYKATNQCFASFQPISNYILRLFLGRESSSPPHTDLSSSSQSYIPLRGHAITTYYTHWERQGEISRAH